MSLVFLMTSGLVNPGFLVYEGRVLPEPVTVSRSLPQGDAWSLIAMVAVLTPATGKSCMRTLLSPLGPSLMIGLGVPSRPKGPLESMKPGLTGLVP